ncbi:MAG: hypothetical protein PUD51_08935 [Prevotellaceae bacterium]|nr:hypothetical protein [Prevotellaceae bacterium]
MGRNTEYIDSYIREIESEKNISNASDKVFGRQKRSQEEEERKTILKNPKKIMEMQKQILDLRQTWEKSGTAFGKSWASPWKIPFKAFERPFKVL